MDPREALDRIVYCMDRVLAPSPKVRAFQNARSLIDELGIEEFEQRHAVGELQDLPGIGKSTGHAIAQALDGQVPDYLTNLEAETALVPELEDSHDLRSKLRGDCHLHSTWSDGGAEIEVMARTAIALGHDYMVMTDHSPRLTIAHGLSAERLRNQLDVIDALNAALAPFRILTGIEVDILADGSLDQDEELLSRLDVVVASVHSKLKMDAKDMTRRMVMAVASPYVDIVGHVTGRKVPGSERQVGKSDFPGRVGSSFDAEIVFAACKKFDTAVEINSRPERQDPPDELLRLALDWDCKIAIDTDAHAPGQLEFQIFGCDKAVRHDVPVDDIVNTWAADDLLEWAGSHRNG